MTLVYMSMDEVDANQSINSAFPGPNIIIRIRLDTNDVQVVFTGGNPPPTGKQGFPKPNVTLAEPIMIAVLPWEGSPGCKTVYVNGTAYERCS